MKYVFPNYDNCLVNVVCSIEKYFNVNPKHKTIEKLDKILDNGKDVTNVIAKKKLEEVFNKVGLGRY